MENFLKGSTDIQTPTNSYKYVYVYENIQEVAQCIPSEYAGKDMFLIHNISVKISGKEAWSFKLLQTHMDVHV